MKTFNKWQFLLIVLSLTGIAAIVYNLSGKIVRSWSMHQVDTVHNLDTLAWSGNHSRIPDSTYTKLINQSQHQDSVIKAHRRK